MCPYSQISLLIQDVNGLSYHEKYDIQFRVSWWYAFLVIGTSKESNQQEPGKSGDGALQLEISNAEM